jgi:opacity protein-like surface antigen
MFRSSAACGLLKLKWLVGLTLLTSSFSGAATFELPAGRTLEIRLTRSLASFSSKRGSEVEGVVISPVLQQGQILIPMGSKVVGTVSDIKRVGVGLIHETARISIDFNRLVLLDGTAVALNTHVTEIDNARESVDNSGRVKGIRSTGTIGYMGNNLIAGVAMFDPVAYLYVTVASARMLRFSEPEIWFPVGTEIVVKLLAPVEFTHVYGPPVPPLQASGPENARFHALLRNLPYRTMTQYSNKPSDLTNLVFSGSPGAVERAFTAAGWVQSDQLNTITGFLTLRSIAESQRYQNAPMSVLLLDEQRPRFTFSKSLDTFSKRHHVRVWLRSETWRGKPILTASSTQDIGIELSRKNRTFIHVINTNIDNERTKIVNDLIFTGCVDAAGLYARPWLPRGAHNATGEELKTDGRVAVLQFNDCLNPKNPVNLQAAPDKPITGPTVQRGFRQGILITRNDLYRGNLIYQGYSGTRLAVRYLKQKNKPQAGSSSPGAEENAISVEPYNEADLQGGAASRPPIEESAPESLNDAAESPKEQGWAPPLFELGLEGGWLRFGNTLDVTNIGVVSQSPEVPSFTLLLQNRLHNGWAAGTSVTLNSWRYFSNEFSFDYQRGKYRLGALFSGFNAQEPANYQEQTTGLLTNQFGYALLINLRPRNKRLRPYVAAGLAFQLLHITDSPFKSSGGIFHVGLRNVGLILAAYNFANEPPLDGGGVFQFGFQYGGGLKYRFSRRWMSKLDYRETLSPQPNFIGRSITIDKPEPGDPFTIDYEANKPAGPLREQRLTAGISFAF